MNKVKLYGVTTKWKIVKKQMSLLPIANSLSPNMREKNTFVSSSKIYKGKYT